MNLDFLVDNIIKKLISDSDRNLLKLFFAKRVTQKMLDNFLKNFDIELEKKEKILLLTYFAREHPNLILPEYTGPRLMGMIDYFKFSNIKTIAGFSRVGKELNKVGIPILLFKGGVMRFLRPDFPRAMGDVDFLVPPERFREAVDMALKAGFKEKFEKEEPHSADLIGKNGEAIDIHSKVLKGAQIKYSDLIAKDLFARAKKTEAFGVEIFLPSNEDATFLNMLNISNNLRMEDGGNGCLFSLVDFDFFVKDGKKFNWDIVIDNAKKTDALCQIRMVAEFFHKLAPSLHTEGLTSRIPMTSKIKKQFDDLIFEWFVFEPLKRYKKTMHWSLIKKQGMGNIFTYLTTKLKFIALKILRKIQPAVSVVANYYQKKEVCNEGM